MEDEAVRIHRKTGGAELWKIVEGEAQAVGQIIIWERVELRELVLKLEIESSAGRRHGCCGGKIGGSHM